MMVETVLDNIVDVNFPAKNIKAIFFDIDGTLLGLDGSYSSATLNEIRRVKNKGVKTAVASGRPQFAAQYLIDALDLNDPGVFCTGAHIYHPEKSETLSMYPLPKGVCKDLLGFFRQMNVHYELYTVENYYIEKNNYPGIKSTHAWHLKREPLWSEFDELIESQPTVKMLAAVDSIKSHDVLYSLEKQFPSLLFGYAGLPAHPDWLFASIVDRTACKEKVFDDLLTVYSITAAEVMSFGDALQDAVFLKKAGVGIAMGNASDEVKKCADYVTRTSWEDGVAYALSRLI